MIFWSLSLFFLRVCNSLWMKFILPHRTSKALSFRALHGPCFELCDSYYDIMHKTKIKVLHLIFKIPTNNHKEVGAYFLAHESEDQVVSTTRQEVDERRPSKSFVQILLLVFCLFELLNSNKCDNVLMCFWHLPLVLWHYNRNYLGKFCWHKQSETLLFLGFLKVFLVFDVFVRLMVFFVEVCFF